jgi:hypothetical protein
MRRMIHAARIFLAVLREVFDEASYARFLERAQATSSSEAYADFWRERAEAQGRRQRCC